MKIDGMRKINKDNGANTSKATPIIKRSKELKSLEGGILILSDGKFWEGAIGSVGAYSISCQFTGKNQEFTWLLT
ncbi:hypothetical protein H5410_036205, partial [Solanum commersonii]